MRLKEKFFASPVENVARNLLGQILIFNNHKGIITETEAYGGADDPASHAYRGLTPRTQVMFGKPGLSYVYLIYGMYHCFNIVTQEYGSPSAVLIRGIKLLTPSNVLLDGPGKVCREFCITKAHNGIDLTINPDFYVGPGERVHNFEATSRIGIRAALDKKWRFVINT